MSEHAKAIEVSGLTKYYGDLLAVDHISFAVREGEVFGFLGPNGAGKTTTIRMLTGLTRPTSGHARVLGFDLASDVARIKKHIGVVPEMSNLYDELSAFDNLVFAMQLYGVPRSERAARAQELLARFRLSEKRDVPFARLSRGMKRALTVAAALAHRPPLVFLDEPTTGLDVMSARNLRQMIAGLRDEGVTVFLTTHYLEEAERLCDRIAILVKGRIVALDTVDGLKATVEGTMTVEVTLADGDGAVETARFEGDDVGATVQAALAQATADGRHVLAVNTVRPTLEDVFVRLTGLSTEVMLAEKGVKEEAMLVDDLRGMFYIGLKDLRAYYFKPPNISWGILFPFAFVLAFAIRNPGDLRGLVPGLLGLTLLFGTSSMEAIVIVFERRIGALERLLLAPVRLPALLAGKLLGGMAFGLTVTLAVLVIVLLAFGAGGVNWVLLVLALILSAAAFSALGAFVSVAVREVFEAQTLANFIRFPMMFLGGVFVPVASLPPGLQVVARALPLTYSVEALHKALAGGPLLNAALDLLVLAAFAVILFALAVRVLAQRLD